jgi:hypothetical protein
MEMSFSRGSLFWYYQTAANNGKNIQNAIRLHLVLLNMVNEAAQLKLTEIIKQKTRLF